MRIKLIFLIVLISLCSLVVQPFLIKIVKADDTDSVSATVMAIVYSVSVSDGEIAFGTVAQNSTEDTTTEGTDDSQTATNNGNVTSKFNIKGEDSTGGTGWTLAASAASETYTMKFCTTDCDTTPDWSSVGIDPDYETLAASVEAAGDQDFDLQVGTPTSTAVTEQQSITVTVQATAP